VKQKTLLIIVLSLSLLCHWLWASVVLNDGIHPFKTNGDGPQNLAIRAGKIWTVTNGVITNGVIIIKNGKIDAVGKNPRIPRKAKILEMPNKSVIPGLIDAHSHLGLSLDVFGEIEEAVLAVTPDMRILDAFNPHADDVKKALRSGVTTVLLAPGYKNPISGQTAVVKLYGAKTDDWVLKRDAGIKFSVGNETLISTRQPTSRPGLIALIREELNKGKDYQEREFNPSVAVLKRVVEGKLPVYIYCNTVDDIATAINIIDEYELNATLVAARDGDEVAKMIAQRNIPVIYTFFSLSKDKDLKRVVKIAGAGVKIAFASLAPKTNLSDLRTSAIIAAKYGLSPEVALKSLTINAAEILGIDKRVGSIEKGKDADLVILNGDPLELTSGVEMVIINGNIVYQSP